MKKFMMTLAAIVCLQGASMNGAWAGIKAAGQGLNAMISSPGAISTGLFTTGLGLMVNGCAQGNTNSKLDMIFGSPGVQKFLGLEKPTTWYGKTWKYMNSFDETVGTVVRWASYADTLSRMAYAMSLARQDDAQSGNQQPSPATTDGAQPVNTKPVIRRARA